MVGCSCCSIVLHLRPSIFPLPFSHPQINPRRNADSRDPRQHQHPHSNTRQHRCRAAAIYHYREYSTSSLAFYSPAGKLRPNHGLHAPSSQRRTTDRPPPPIAPPSKSPASILLLLNSTPTPDLYSDSPLNASTWNSTQASSHTAS